MNDASRLKKLEVSVANFGPIVEANIDLRPMTVFVGPSNTGKSYLAILIYALHSFFGGTRFDPRYGRTFRTRSIFSSRRRPRDNRPLSEQDSDELFRWFEEMTDSVYEGRVAEDLLFDTPESVARLVRLRIADTDGLEQLLDGEWSRCFGIADTKSLIRNGARDGMRVSVARRGSSSRPGDASIEYEYTKRDDGIDLAALVSDATPVRVPALANAPVIDIQGDIPGGISRLAEIILNELVSEYMATALTPLTNRAYYLPADRTGIMHAHKVVVSSLIGRAPMAGLGTESPLPALSGVLADFLQILIGLRSERPSRSRVQRERAELLEQNILKGKIRSKETVTGYPEFFYRPDGWREDLPLMNASSMVSELAPVVLYLRHVVKSGDVLIIEEPESHLHPAMQVAFIRHLAAVAHAGIRVMLTTHSEWVLDELANLVHLSSLPESDREGIGGADYALCPDDVGVWLFERKKRPKGAVVREIPFSGEYGGFASDFEPVAMSTYNDFAGISNRIESQRST